MENGTAMGQIEAIISSAIIEMGSCDFLDSTDVKRVVSSTSVR